jgi:NCS1 family nucleobase:cation symporter-1
MEDELPLFSAASHGSSPKCAPISQPTLFLQRTIPTGGYGIFLAPIAGMLIADYWIVKEQKINIPAPHDPDG